VLKPFWRNYLPKDLCIAWGKRWVVLDGRLMLSCSHWGMFQVP
jgi:hypothetical protein